MSEANVLLMLNGVPVKCKQVFDVSKGAVIDGNFPTTSNNNALSLKELAQRLNHLNEMNEKTPGLAFEAARRLDDELEKTGCGLRVTSTEDWEYMLYYKALDQLQESILISQLVERG